MGIRSSFPTCTVESHGTPDDIAAKSGRMAASPTISVGDLDAARRCFATDHEHGRWASSDVLGGPAGVLTASRAQGFDAVIDLWVVGS